MSSSAVVNGRRTTYRHVRSCKVLVSAIVVLDWATGFELDCELLRRMWRLWTKRTSTKWRRTGIDAEVFC
jgi:hypothetical protein